MIILNYKIIFKLTNKNKLQIKIDKFESTTVSPPSRVGIKAARPCHPILEATQDNFDPHNIVVDIIFFNSMPFSNEY